MQTPEIAQTIDLSSEDILFISDVHLGGFPPQRDDQIQSDLLSLLNHAQEQRMRIVILGDLTDYFMEYDGWVPHCGKAVFTWFREYHNRGNKPALFITGNHDNWSTDFYTKTGFLLSHESFRLTIGARQCLLLHGDGLSDSTMNLPRPGFHRLLRNPYFVGIFKALTSPAVGNEIMRWFSRYNRTRKGEIDLDFERLDFWAHETLKRNVAQIIIAGHHHHARFSQLSGSLYINTGAFFHDRTCALYDTNEGFRLVRWQSATTDFSTIHTETGPTRQ